MPATVKERSLANQPSSADAGTIVPVLHWWVPPSVPHSCPRARVKVGKSGANEQTSDKVRPPFPLIRCFPSCRPGPRAAIRTTAVRIC